MADYPLPVFHFVVDWGGGRAGFTEASGFTYEVEKIEYREGNMQEYSKINMPGMVKFSNITLKRGVVAKDNDFWKWISATKMNKPERRELTISLLNEEHQAVMSWKVKNAWPVKVEGPGLKADGNEAAIETLELSHEGLTIENG